MISISLTWFRVCPYYSLNAAVLYRDSVACYGESAYTLHARPLQRLDLFKGSTRLGTSITRDLFNGKLGSRVPSYIL